MPKARCARCHRPLKDPYSIAIGLGPECRQKLIRAGHSIPKPVYRITNGKVELVGMTGEVDKLPVNLETIDGQDAGHREQQDRQD